MMSLSKINISIFTTASSTLITHHWIYTNSFMKVSKIEQLKRIKDNVTDSTVTLENLKLDIDCLEETLRTTPLSEEFIVWDYLEITNNYLGKKGTVRKVIFTTKKQCIIRDSNRHLHTRSRTNFILLSCSKWRRRKTRGIPYTLT